jgi:alkylation response protein AidB-like acyl-CoA dehydrogenase
MRDRLAQLHAGCEKVRFLGYRIITGVLQGDGTLGPESSIAKPYWSEYHQAVTDVAVDVLGADAIVMEGCVPLRASCTDDPRAHNNSGSWVGTLRNATAGTIYAGTSEEQRNILAEVVLGLPRKPRR